MQWDISLGKLKLMVNNGWLVTHRWVSAWELDCCGEFQRGYCSTQNILLTEDLCDSHSWDGHWSPSIFYFISILFKRVFLLWNVSWTAHCINNNWSSSEYTDQTWAVFFKLVQLATHLLTWKMVRGPSSSVFWNRNKASRHK